MSDERVNIFQNLDRDSFKLIRQGIIDLVLATDMSKHFVHLNKFVSVFTNSIVSVCRYFTNYLILFSKSFYSSIKGETLQLLFSSIPNQWTPIREDAPAHR